MRSGKHATVRYCAFSPENVTIARRLRAIRWCPALFSVIVSIGALDVFAASPELAREIQPVLSKHCYECHGPDANARKAALRLDTKSGVEKGILVPGDPAASELFRRITSKDPDFQMPPPGPNRGPLDPADIEKVRLWIVDGASWAQHWAFETVVAPSLPVVGSPAWGVNPIDLFILARLRAEGLAPSPEADKVKLLRRVTFDLTGLPPTLTEIDEFLADTRPEAYECVVDRLFASPRYGEQMAMHWLDAARFADTNGYQGDFIRYMYLWRDWVIDAYNANMPWDAFVVEQIAGDLLPGATPQQKLATGFVRNGRSVTEGGAIEEEWRIESVVDRVETVGTAFLGLSLGCARCHDHKYDPISQREFYQFFAFFNSTAEKGVYLERHGNTGPTVRFPSPEQETHIAELDAQVAAAKNALTLVETETRLPIEDWISNLRTMPRKEEPSSLSIRLRLDGDQTSPIGGAQALRANAAPDLGQAFPFVREAPFTVALWVRPDGTGPIWSNTEDGPTYRGVEVAVLDDGRIAVEMNHQRPDDALRIVSDPVLKMGVWAHVAITYAGNGVTGGLGVYVDSEFIGWLPYNDHLIDEIASTQSLRVGVNRAGAQLSGAVADFRIYNAALNPAQVRSLMENSVANATTARLDETYKAMMSAFYGLRNELWPLSEKRDLAGQEGIRTAYLEIEVPSVMILEELPEPRPTYRLVRGAYDAPDTSEVLLPAVPAFLPDLPEGVQVDRLALARWLVDPLNPLTARVAVNRMWQTFFGTGIVSTPDNFGTQGAAPSHPELLDWLASEFMQSGWDVKALQRMIVLSATYRQDSILSDDLRARDPDNRLLARAPRFRMNAESIRDNALAVSGLLTPTIGGPSVMPYQPEGLWDELASVLRGLYHEAEGPDLYRRSLYTFRKRTVPHPTLATFDAPTFEICQMKRARANTPLQALALLNDPTYVEAARHLASRMIAEGGSGSDGRLRYGFRLATGRWPNDREEQVLRGAITVFLHTFQNAPEDGKAFIASGKSPVDAMADPVELAAYMGVARIVLSLDETITRE